MEAIRYIMNVKDKSITINGLDNFNNKKVEIIIIPLENEEDDIFSDVQNKLKNRKVKSYSEKEIESIVHSIRGI